MGRDLAVAPDSMLLKMPYIAREYTSSDATRVPEQQQPSIGSKTSKMFKSVVRS